MVAARACAVIIAWFVGAAACSSREPSTLRLLELSRAPGGGCVVHEVCPGTDCHPALPYETACPEDEHRMRAEGEAPELDGTRSYGRLADGSCRERTRTCQNRACLGAATACPPPPLRAPLPTLRWTVEHTAESQTCRVVPEPPTELSAKVAPLTVACTAYEDIHSIERRPDGTCMGLDDFPCPEGALCEPTEHHGPLPCPTR